MMFGADSVAEAVRLMGATLVCAALGLVLLDERSCAPLRVGLLGVVALALGSIALLFLTVAPIAQRFDESLPPLTLEYLEHSVHGRMLLAPVLPAAYALLMLGALRTAPAGPRRRVLCGMLGGALFCIAWLLAVGGHGSMEEDRRVETVAQILHLAAGLAWAALLLSLLPSVVRGDPLGGHLRRSGNVALGLVVVLVVASVISAWSRGVRLPVNSVDAYSLLIMLKAGVLLLALCAAAWNRLVELRSGLPSEPRLRWVVGFEAGLLLLAMMLAAGLSRTPQPAA
jgi:putative copper export protein